MSSPESQESTTRSSRGEKLLSFLRISLIAEIVLLTLLSFYFLELLNFHMDEAQIAYPLGCYYSHYSGETTLREACGMYDLRLPFWKHGPELPLRVASYVGSIQGLLYYPFWAIIPNVLSVRVFRIFLLWAGIWGITRALKVPRVPVLTGTCSKALTLKLAPSSLLIRLSKLS